MGNLFSAKSPISVREISSTELFNIQANLRSFYLLIDCRSHEEYQLSHIDLSINLFSIALPEDFSPYCCCEIILYGSDLDNCLSSRKEAESFLIKNSIPYEQITFLRDPFSDYQISYPYLCSNHPNYLQGRLFPSKIAENVFLSNYGVASNPDILQLLGITHILNCTKDCPFAGSNGVDDTELLASSSLNFSFLRVPVVDERDQEIHFYFQQAIDFIESALGKDGNRVVIHCKHGQSRSATIAAAWLIQCRGHTTDGAISYLKECRPKVSPNEGFITQLKSFELSG
jgi:protein-tyrosine phosphatase